MTPPDHKGKEAVAGLAQRLAERDHVLVVAKITKRDEGGAYVRRATLDDLKGARRA